MFGLNHGSRQPRIHQRHTGIDEVCCVACHDREAVLDRSGGNHRVALGAGMCSDANTGAVLSVKGKVRAALQGLDAHLQRVVHHQLPGLRGQDVERQLVHQARLDAPLKFDVGAK